jgi:endonuclease/exonuclease/phosphatase family metal-dependent hydrolase
MAWFTDHVDGRRFGVANAHLDERSDEIRQRSTAALVAWIDELRTAGDDRPWIVVGDLNATPADASVQVLLTAGWHDALGAIPSYGPESATANEFSGRRNGARIDHILVEDAASVQQAHIDHSRPHGRLGSDHWPVVASLR